MNEPQPKSYFGRVILLNLGLVVALHVGRELLDERSGIYGMLYLLSFLNFALALFGFATSRGSIGRACLLSTLLIGIAGFSDCATHMHFSVQ
jgi:hypothetical protein